MNNDIRPPQQRGSVPRYERPVLPTPQASTIGRYAVPQQVVVTPPATPPPSTPDSRAPESTQVTAPNESQSFPSSLPSVAPIAAPSAEVPVKSEEISSHPHSTGNKKRKRLVTLIGLAIGVIILAAVAGVLWYVSQLRPMTSSDNAATVQLKVESDSTANQIAQQLKSEGLIRNELAFNVYTRLSGARANLKAGSYILSTDESVQQIVEHLMMGRVDELEVTFYPGAALSSSASSDKTPSHKKVLQELGYDDAEINAAFTAEYDHPLLASRPAGADLEGYILGDTYRIAAGSSVEEVLERTFDVYYERLEAEGVLSVVAQGNRNLHDVIILASIVQREVAVPADQPQVAQVFLSRLKAGMNLGSDVTYQYIADKTGVPRDVNLDSPYNTRRYTGLPPGPIASPGISAIKAVVNPAEGDYLFFLSGDDDVTYFAKTVEEHERNIKDHCAEKCTIL